jgi:hypothetical protein
MGGVIIGRPGQETASRQRSSAAVAIGRRCGTDNEQVHDVLLKDNRKNLVEHYFKHSMSDNR